MNTVAPIKDLVFAFLEERSGLSEADLAKVDENFNLLANGYLDSGVFVDLLTHLEEKTGIAIDFSEADPMELATLAGLQRHYCGTGLPAHL